MDLIKILTKVKETAPVVISTSKNIAGKLIDYSLEQQAGAQRRLDDSRARAKRLSNKELEQKVMKAHSEGRRDLETGVLAQEYMERKKAGKI